MSIRPLLSVVKVAKILGLSPQTVRRLCKDNKLPAINVANRGAKDQFRVSEEA